MSDQIDQTKQDLLYLRLKQIQKTLTTLQLDILAFTDEYEQEENNI